MMKTPARLLVAIAVLALAACDTANTDPTDEAPAPLPAAAFSFDADLNQSSSARSAAGLHFFTAATRVGIVSFAIKANLVLPAVMTGAATSVDPVVEDGTWIWSSTRPVDGTDATFRLEGTPSGSSIDWQLRVTTASPATGDELDDFVLYTATTSLDGKTGSWRLYYRIEGQRTEVVRADYDITDDANELTFTAVNESDIQGSTVLYRTEGDTNTFDWVKEPGSVRTLVEWSESTGVGFVEADDYNGGARACWNTSFDDAACEAS